MSSETQAKSQLVSVIELVDALDNAKTDTERESAVQRIQEDALSVQVRSGWYSPGGEHKPEEFEILLCTGGPACRIIGNLNEHLEPESARIEHQDWGTPWTEYHLDGQPLAKYVRLVNECGGNMRMVLSKIESGVMLK